MAECMREVGVGTVSAWQQLILKARTTTPTLLLHTAIQEKMLQRQNYTGNLKHKKHMGTYRKGQ